MKNWIIYLLLVLFDLSPICFATGHDAYAHFEFCNSLKKRNVILRPIEVKHDEFIEGFKEFPETELVPQQKIFFKENLKGYQENTSEDPFMLIIGVYVDDTRVGLIKLVKTLQPDPSFVFETEKNDLGLELRMQRQRFSCGKRTIEVALRTRLQR